VQELSPLTLEPEGKKEKGEETDSVVHILLGSLAPYLSQKKKEKGLDLPFTHRVAPELKKGGGRKKGKGTLFFPLPVGLLGERGRKRKRKSWFYLLVQKGSPCMATGPRLRGRGRGRRRSVSCRYGWRWRRLVRKKKKGGEGGGGAEAFYSA